MQVDFSEVDEHCLGLWHGLIVDAIKEHDVQFAKRLRLATNEICPGLVSDTQHCSRSDAFRGAHCLTKWLDVIKEALRTRDHQTARTLRIISDEIYPGLVEVTPPRQNGNINESYSVLPLRVYGEVAGAILRDSPGATGMQWFPDDTRLIYPSEPSETGTSVPEPLGASADISSVEEHLRLFQISEDEIEISRQLLDGEIDMSNALDQLTRLVGARIPRYSSENGVVVDVEPSDQK